MNSLNHQLKERKAAAQVAMREAGQAVAAGFYSVFLLGLLTAASFA